jgi:Adenine specific DNA methylase Mod
MQKLELTWIGKGDEPVVEPRILLHDTSKDYGDPAADNMLIHGDNLLALKALVQEFAGRVKCIYIDPPYNTGAAFDYFEDNLEHSIWLQLMKQRLDVLYNLLSPEGSLWISIDNTEGHYLKVMLDEIFKRSCFVADITYEKSNVSGLGQGGQFFNTGEKILVYKKETLELNEVLGTEILELKTMKRYNKVLLSVGDKELVEEFPAASNGKPVKVYKHTGFEVTTVSLRDFENREQEIRSEFTEHFEQMFRTYVIQQENEFQNALMKNMSKDALYSVEYTPNRGRYKDELTTLYYYKAELCAWLKDTSFIQDGQIMKTTRLSNVWKNDDIPKADLGNEGGVNFPRAKKPERLLERIIALASNPGDIVLDSFLGSGTTAAVAHKMGRQYIGIELGEHCYTHCLPRLKAVVDGEQGGVSKAQNWQGGGGFKFYELAPTLIVKDAHGQPIINDKYNAQMLVAAIAKLNGYDYAPDRDVFWKQGKSQAGSYIFVTTEYLTAAQLDDISRDLPEYERLLICAPAFDIGLGKRYENINVRKIPQSVLDKCKYGVDNYNLNIVNPPELDEDEWEDGENA